MDPANVEIKVHDWKHGVRVRNWALKIANGEGYGQRLLVEIAALLHDIGRLYEKKRKVPHAKLSGEVVQEYLSSKDWLSKEEQDEVVYAVGNHSIGGKTKLVHIIQDADRLDGFGAIGIAKSFQAKWYIPDYNPKHPFTPFTLTKPQVDEFFSTHQEQELVPYGLDHLGYLISWYEQMNTTTGKTLATPLIEYMKNFINQFKRELNQ